MTIGCVSSTSGQLGSQLPLMSRGSKPMSPPMPKDWTSMAKSTPVWTQVCPPLGFWLEDGGRGGQVGDTY